MKCIDAEQKLNITIFDEQTDDHRIETMTIEEILDTYTNEGCPEGCSNLENDWIPCSERLPDCEQEVLICTERKFIGRNSYIDSIVTPALYEDGTMSECDSKWSWVDMDFDKWDEENDCGIIPAGWWENRHFYIDDNYNNPVDQKVVAWMPLPEPYRGEQDD